MWAARVFVGCNLFFYLRKMNVRQFLKIFVAELKYIFLSYAFPIMYATIRWFFWSTYFHQFQQQTFFSDHIFNKRFFLAPPPPRYQMVMA